MANLLQVDYDNLVPQLVTGKRTSGSFSGKTMKPGTLEFHRGAQSSVPGTPSVQIFYTDNTSEMLLFEPYVECYPPGMGTPKASAGTP